MKCFVIMPFATAFDSVFEVVKKTAISAVPDTTFECYWLKDVQSAGCITDDILEGLNNATFCIADVSGHNPNVMWETGYAMALGKPTILIGQDIEALPFDLKSHRVLAYSRGNESELGNKLAEAVRQTLSRYALKGTSATQLPPTKSVEHRTITVTGTMRANEAVAIRRLERVLAPYLAEETMWLTGSNGVIDVAAARFLVERNQRVAAVGYNRFDCASELRRLVEASRLTYIDASLERIPKAMSGPNQRDILFCMKSDLVILIWDGSSQGTSNIVKYLQSQGIANLIEYL